MAHSACCGNCLSIESRTRSPAAAYLRQVKRNAARIAEFRKAEIQNIVARRIDHCQHAVGLQEVTV